MNIKDIKTMKIVGDKSSVHSVARFFRNNRLGYQKSLRKSSSSRTKKNSLESLYVLNVVVSNDSCQKINNYIKLKNTTSLKVFTKDMA